MTRTLLGIGTAVAMSIFSLGAQAMPVSAGLAIGDAPLVEQVADGCGPGFFRGRRGYCRPFRGGGYGGPRFLGPRFFHGGPRFHRGGRHHGGRHHGGRHRR